MFLIFGKTDEVALEAAEKAVDAIRTFPCVLGKFASSGTKVGGKNYKNAVATTNDAYCPTLATIENSRIPHGVKCVYEVIVTALRAEDLNAAMKAGIEQACTVDGVNRITSSNYGGTLGKGKIHLHTLFASDSKLREGKKIE